MECPVCYNPTTNKLFCGHLLCKSCVKEWYFKSTDLCNCPMCRKPVYYKGFPDMVKQWQEEKNEKLYDDIFELIFERMCECFEEENDVGYLHIIKDAQKKLNLYRFSEMELGYDDLMEFLLDDDWTYYVIKELYGNMSDTNNPPPPKKSSHTLLKKVKHPLNNKIHGALQSSSEPSLFTIEYIIL